MSSLAELPNLIGFFSYSREDDEDSMGALSALRDRIQRELRAQLGRSFRDKDFRLWQDKEAIAPGHLWEREIKAAVAEAVFFIAIVTPTAVKSAHCLFEFTAFLQRERALGRTDLVFPMLYLPVPALNDEIKRRNNPVLSIIGARQYVDWRELRHEEIHAVEVKKAVAKFCANIADALRKPWNSPSEQEQEEEPEPEQAVGERRQPSAGRRHAKGNIYLAKVTRVEPSLQAAFVEYGGDRPGFLAFNEINPDYFQIPVAVRRALIDAEDGEAAGTAIMTLHWRETDDGGVVDQAPKPMSQLRHQYKIEDVIKRRQVMLVQVVKEEGATKGAALTTYLSLAGRYSVLMVNTIRGGGVSRGISNAAERKRLEQIAKALEVPEGMGVILRAEAISGTRTEITHDFQQVLRAWEAVRDLTLKSYAPTLVYEERSPLK
jgi:hypothetical protein